MLIQSWKIPRKPGKSSSMQQPARNFRNRLRKPWRWNTAKENPVVARVFVNRLWKLFYGQGLVTSLDDFGSQGSWPTHPELLDWLAVEFRESGWDVKHMIRLMLESRTYQQTSVATLE